MKLSEITYQEFLNNNFKTGDIFYLKCIGYTDSSIKDEVVIFISNTDAWAECYSAKNGIMCYCWYDYIFYNIENE